MKVGSFKHISWNEVFNLFHLTDFPGCIQQLVIIDKIYIIDKIH